MFGRHFSVARIAVQGRFAVTDCKTGGFHERKKGRGTHLSILRGAQVYSMNGMGLCPDTYKIYVHIFEKTKRAATTALDLD